jgi:anthranilate synthase component 2
VLNILLIDNYDSFTYNLVHYFEKLGCNVDVFKNDDQIPDVSVYDALVLSPGPGLPYESGFLMKIITTSIGKIPILGICLGMQALALVLEGELYNQKRVKHGVSELIRTEKGVLFSVSGSQIVGLYHSWALKDKGNFRITARNLEGTIMAIENEEQMCFAVQFHPESVMTENGIEILENFLNFCLQGKNKIQG